jgi:hypothetical protein
VWKSNFPYCDKITAIKSHKRGEELFWLMVLEIPVHGHLASLLWAWGEAETSWWKGMAEDSCFPHDSQEAEREKKGPNPKNNLKIMSPVSTTTSSKQPHLPVSTSSPKSHQTMTPSMNHLLIRSGIWYPITSWWLDPPAGSKTSPHEFWQDTSYPNCNSGWGETKEWQPQ